jgi:hypothetical protein
MTNKLRVKEVEFFERDVKFRLPFKFGVITLTEEPQTFVRVRIELENGQENWGMAAEVLGPKWFDKTPDLSNEENMQQLRRSLAVAQQIYSLEKGFATPFGLFSRHYEPQIGACRKLQMNPLVASFGPALLDRAILDALCRSHGISFYEAIRANLVGMKGQDIVPELSDFDFDSFLAGLKPAERIHARHTVGLSDPIISSDGEASRVNDGLPETLEEVISFYGNTYFKLKVCGEIGADLERLAVIASVLDRHSDHYFVTLDGNEQYKEIEAVEELWRKVCATRALKRLEQAVLFIEQPLNRIVALDQDVSQLSQLRPVIIDESDEDLDAFPKAKYLGYRGVSSKQCKGFYKAIINLCRCFLWNSRLSADRYFMSGEDLTLQSGVAVQQDLALASLLGLKHLERNGHHYVTGMKDLPVAEQNAFLSAHPDLYTKDSGLVRLNIIEGMLNIGSLSCPGYASAAEPCWSEMRRVVYRTDRTDRLTRGITGHAV